MRTEVELTNSEGVPPSPVAQTCRTNLGMADSIGSLSHPSVSWRRICMGVRGVREKQEPPHRTLSPRIAMQLHGLFGAPLNVMNYSSGTVSNYLGSLAQ